MEIAWSNPRSREKLASAELILLAKQRDSATWSFIYSEHFDAIYRYLLGRLGRKEEAEDMAAQVFLEALKSIDSFNARGKPLVAWLFGIARNLVNNQHRRQRPQVELEPDHDVLDDWSADEDVRLDAIELAGAIEGLTSEQREVVVLRFFVGLTAKEVARILGKSEPAIYSLQVRAMTALRQQLRSNNWSESTAKAAS